MGPGPMETIRFKWTVRREGNGQYFVDETIGENSPAGDQRTDAGGRSHPIRGRSRERGAAAFERLKSEMSGRAAVANVVRHEGHEGGEM